jgi:hypothetical protein
MEGGVEEVRAEGAGLVQLRRQRVALPQQRLHLSHLLTFVSLLHGNFRSQVIGQFQNVLTSIDIGL